MTTQPQNTAAPTANTPRPDCAPQTREELRDQMREHMVERQRVYDKLGRS